jgi:hypothetical protein
MSVIEGSCRVGFYGSRVIGKFHDGESVFDPETAVVLGSTAAKGVVSSMAQTKMGEMWQTTRRIGELEPGGHPGALFFFLHGSAESVTKNLKIFSAGPFRLATAFWVPCCGRWDRRRLQPLSGHPE